MGDDWTQDLWGDLLKNNPERWDIHDAFRLGKRESQEDTSSNKKERPRQSNSTEDVKEPTNDGGISQSMPGKIFIDAREWEGRGLNQAVMSGQLTADQAFSILKLRQASIKPGPDKKEDEIIEAIWKNLKGDREGRQ